MATRAVGATRAAGGEQSESRGGRLLGMDVARAAAIIGMFMVHMGPTHVPDLIGMLYALPHGRASVLFVFLAGVGVSLLARSGRSAAEVRRLLAWRAAVLFPLGLALQALEHRVLVILPVYAALFLVGMMALNWGDQRLQRLAASAALGGPVVFLYGRMTAPAVFDRGALTWSQPPLELLHGLLLSGPYPVMVWVAPFLFGMWLGRRNLRSTAVRARMVAWGVGVAAGAAAVSGLLQLVLVPRSFPVTWAWIVVDTPHSQMPLWLVESTAAAVAVLGLCLEVGDRWRESLRPVATVGQMALTVYAGHLLLLHGWGGAHARTVEEAVGVVALVTALAVAFTAVWRVLVPRGPLARGPLEALVRLPVRPPPFGEDKGANDETVQ